MAYSRREFGQMMIAGIPITAMMLRSAGVDSTVGGVKLGTITYSFHDMKPMVGKNYIDQIIEDCKGSGVGYIELMSNHCQPYTQAQADQAAAAAAARAAGGGNRGPAGPQTQNGGEPADPAAKKIRDDLREWRLKTPMSYFSDIKKQLNDAGIQIYSYTVNQLGADFTDEEIDKMWQQAKTLGVKSVASSTTIANTKRVVPAIEKYKIPIAVHGHTNVADPNEYSSPDSFKRGMALSKYVWVNLDIGHYTAANFDAVAFIQENHDRISHLHMKDRMKDGGPNKEWGQGQTPIKEVLTLLKEKKYPIPAIIELEYTIPAGSNCTAETKKCMDYMKNILA